MTWIPEQVFYNKPLSDAIRDVVIKSPCSFEQAHRLLKDSTNLERDANVIKEMRNQGLSERLVARILINL